MCVEKGVPQPYVDNVCPDIQTLRIDMYRYARKIPKHAAARSTCSALAKGRGRTGRSWIACGEKHIPQPTPLLGGPNICRGSWPRSLLVVAKHVWALSYHYYNLKNNDYPGDDLLLVSYSYHYNRLPGFCPSSWDRAYTALVRVWTAPLLKIIIVIK